VRFLKEQQKKIQGKSNKRKKSDIIAEEESRVPRRKLCFFAACGAEPEAARISKRVLKESITGSCLPTR
jgi:hypothetical protein